MFCDLHTHSIFSDGTCTPEEIIAKAKELELVVALTDHNTTKGLGRFLAEAERQGVTAVGGVEISTFYGGHELHLLGLFVDKSHYEEIEDLLEEFHYRKEQSNINMVSLLNEAGYDINYEEIKSTNPSRRINRAHIGAELVKKGYLSTVSEAFNTILREGNGFYFPPERLDTLFATRFLKSLGALPVLAHPFLAFNEKELREFLPKAIENGLAGMETEYSEYDEKTTALSRKTAEEFGILKSGGSDYHGNNKPHISLGIGKGNLHVPIEIYEDLLKAHNAL